MVQIIPTILVKTFEEFQSAVRRIENDFLVAQIDVMDGKFVPNTTFFDPKLISTIETTLQYELHLMVENPLKYIKQISPLTQPLPKRERRIKKNTPSPLGGEGGPPAGEAGGERLKVRKILFHAEAVEDPRSVAREIQKIGKKAFLALNPETPLDALESCIECLDGIMLMGVHPGFAGQKFLPHTIDRVREIHKKYPHMPIEVDGGVSDKNAAELMKAGATILAVHSFLYQGDIREQKEKLLKILPSS